MSIGETMARCFHPQTVRTELAHLCAQQYMHELPENIRYHTWDHTFADDTGVAAVAERIARDEGLNAHDTELLVTAAYFHDVGYSRASLGHEYSSVVIAQRALPQMGYSADEIKTVSALIMATKLPTRPQTALEGILCDADADSLGRGDFWDRMQLLRQELGKPDTSDWYRDTREFMRAHQWYTTSQYRMRDMRKRENLERVQQYIKTLEGW
jgi:uncharacterized protein